MYGSWSVDTRTRMRLVIADRGKSYLKDVQSMTVDPIHVILITVSLIITSLFLSEARSTMHFSNYNPIVRSAVFEFAVTASALGVEVGEVFKSS